MKVFHTLSELGQWRTQQKKIAFVPTMGNLHRGHLSLIELAKENADDVIVSIFVNPLQFAPHEDFADYPRTLDQDLEKLAAIKTTAVFLPSILEMYPKGREYQTCITVPDISLGLCGASRPGFFQGVATVVCKLLNCVRPDVAVFGEKDFQQLLVIKKMVLDLNMPIEIIGAPIVRESNGLALSSRNQYLSPEQKTRAGLIFQALQSAAASIRSGTPITGVLKSEPEKLSHAGFKVDYFELRDGQDLKSLTEMNDSARLFIAAQLGTTRLIDNLKV